MNLPALLPVTALYAALTGIFIIFLSYKVVLLRQKFKIGLGDKSNKEISIAMRAQANATEYLPIALILMAIAEVNHASDLGLHIFGAMLVLSRVLHAWGFYTSQGKTHFGRYHGTLWTWVAIVGLSFWNIWLIL